MDFWLLDGLKMPQTGVLYLIEQNPNYCLYRKNFSTDTFETLKMVIYHNFSKKYESSEDMTPPDCSKCLKQLFARSKNLQKKFSSGATAKHYSGNRLKIFLWTYIFQNSLNFENRRTSRYLLSTKCDFHVKCNILAKNFRKSKFFFSNEPSCSGLHFGVKDNVITSTHCL